MKCQILFSWKNKKKKYFEMLSAEILPSMQSIKLKKKKKRENV